MIVDCEVVVSRFECSATVRILLCEFVKVPVGDANLFGDFPFLVKDSDLCFCLRTSIPR
jgi:hypothetical protein